MRPARSRRAVPSAGRWLTTDEVTTLLRVAPGTVYRLVTSAALPAARVGGQWRFKASDVEDWLAQHRGAAPDPRQGLGSRRTARPPTR